MSMSKWAAIGLPVLLLSGIGGLYIQYRREQSRNEAKRQASQQARQQRLNAATNKNAKASGAEIDIDATLPQSIDACINYRLSHESRPHTKKESRVMTMIRGIHPAAVAEEWSRPTRMKVAQFICLFWNNDKPIGLSPKAELALQRQQFQDCEIAFAALWSVRQEDLEANPGASSSSAAAKAAKRNTSARDDDDDSDSDERTPEEMDVMLLDLAARTLQHSTVDALASNAQSQLVRALQFSRVYERLRATNPNPLDRKGWSENAAEFLWRSSLQLGKWKDFRVWTDGIVAHEGASTLKGLTEVAVRNPATVDYAPIYQQIRTRSMISLTNEQIPNLTWKLFKVTAIAVEPISTDATAAASSSIDPNVGKQLLKSMNDRFGPMGKWAEIQHGNQRGGSKVSAVRSLILRRIGPCVRLSGNLEPSAIVCGMVDFTEGSAGDAGFSSGPPSQTESFNASGVFLQERGPGQVLHVTEEYVNFERVPDGIPTVKIIKQYGSDSGSAAPSSAESSDAGGTGVNNAFTAFAASQNIGSWDPLHPVTLWTGHFTFTFRQLSASFLKKLQEDQFLPLEPLTEMQGVTLGKVEYKITLQCREDKEQQQEESSAADAKKKPAAGASSAASASSK